MSTKKNLGLKELIAIANFKIRSQSNASTIITITSIIVLSMGSTLIIWYEYKTEPEQMVFIVILYILLTIGAYVYSVFQQLSQQNNE